MKTTFPIITLVSALCFVGVSTSLPTYAVSEQKVEEAEPEKGPNNGRMLREGDFAIELSIFETGVPPEFRVWATADGKAIEPSKIDLNVKLTRLGDGIDDIGYRNPATGIWYLYKSDGYSHASDKGGDYSEIYFGSKEEDIPVHGDFDGDGIDDIAVRRPSIGSFFIKHSSTGKIYRTFFGSQPTDIPVVDDYDGDGKTDIAVRRDSASGVYALSTRYNQILRKGFGSYSTDVFTASPIMSKMEKAAIIQQYGTGTEQRIDSPSTALPLDIEHFATEEVENGNF